MSRIHLSGFHQWDVNSMRHIDVTNSLEWNSRTHKDMRCQVIKCLFEFVTFAWRIGLVRFRCLVSSWHLHDSSQTVMRCHINASCNCHELTSHLTDILTPYTLLCGRRCAGCDYKYIWYRAKKKSLLSNTSDFLTLCTLRYVQKSFGTKNCLFNSSLSGPLSTWDSQ